MAQHGTVPPRQPDLRKKKGLAWLRHGAAYGFTAMVRDLLLEVIETLIRNDATEDIFLAATRGLPRVNSTVMAHVTHILSAIEPGDPKAADELLPLVYDELRRLAADDWLAKSPGKRLRRQPSSMKPTCGW